MIQDLDEIKFAADIFKIRYSFIIYYARFLCPSLQILRRILQAIRETTTIHIALNECFNIQVLKVYT